MDINSIMKKYLIILLSLMFGFQTAIYAKKEIRIGVLYDYTGPLAGAGGI